MTAGDHWIAVGFPKQFEGLPVAVRRQKSVDASHARRARRPRGRRARSRRGVPRHPPDAANNNDERRARRSSCRPAHHLERGCRVPTTWACSRWRSADLTILRLSRRLKAGERSSSARERTAGCARRIVEPRAARVPSAGQREATVDQIMAHAERARRSGRPVRRAGGHGDSGHARVAEFSLPNRAGSLVAGRAQAVGRAGAYYLNDHELASRLSYFLWSSMPDEDLLRAADQGTLRRRTCSRRRCSAC